MDKILQRRVVPIATIDRVEDAGPLAEALLQGGLDIIEVTFRTPAAPAAVQKIARAYPELLVGAGTLLDTDQVQRAVDAGARFGVSPGLNETVVRRAGELGLPFMPGVTTATEVEGAMALGCRILKFFPAELAGGVAMLKAFAGPYGHTGVKFVPLGGITLANAGPYLRLPIVGAIGGSWLADRKLIETRNWAAITSHTAEMLKLIAELRAG